MIPTSCMYPRSALVTLPAPDCLQQLEPAMTDVHKCSFISNLGSVSFSCSLPFRHPFMCLLHHKVPEKISGRTDSHHLHSLVPLCRLKRVILFRGSRFKNFTRQFLSPRHCNNAIRDAYLSSGFVQYPAITEIYDSASFCSLRKLKIFRYTRKRFRILF